VVTPLGFIQSEEFEGEISSIADNSDDLKVEIGLLFLADTLAKTDLRFSARTDEEIERNAYIVQREVQERGLHPNLVNAAKQIPVSLEVARKYLRFVTEDI